MGVPYLLPVRPIEKYETRLDEQMVPVRGSPGAGHRPVARSARAPAGRSRALRRDLASVAPRRPGIREGTPCRPLRRRSCSAQGSSAARDRRARRPARTSRRSLRRSASSWRSVCANSPSPPPGFPTPRRRPARGSSAFRTPAAARVSRWISPAGPPCPSACRAANRASPKRPSNAWARWSPRWPTISSRYLDQPFAFFGHSMGAAVAFELVRELRRRSRPLPERADRLRRPRAAIPPPSRAAARAVARSLPRGTAPPARHPGGSALRPGADARHPARARSRRRAVSQLRLRGRCAACPSPSAPTAAWTTPTCAASISTDGRSRPPRLSPYELFRAAISI